MWDPTPHDAFFFAEIWKRDLIPQNVPEIPQILLLRRFSDRGTRPDAAARVRHDAQARLEMAATTGMIVKGVQGILRAGEGLRRTSRHVYCVVITRGLLFSPIFPGKLAGPVCV